MRLLVKLRATTNVKNQTQYNKNVQGLVYNILRGSEFNCHDESGYRFFSFSNIFPSKFENGDIRNGDIRNLIISSPNDRFISYLKEQLEYLQNIQIGWMKFRVEYASKLNIILPHHMFSLITQTPIVINIRKYRYEELGYTVNNGYDSAYWRHDKPLKLFVTQLHDNLVKKYNAYQGSDNDVEVEFTRFRFLREAATRLDQKNIKIGSKWEFIFPQSSPILQFGFDAGFGESASLGFGFMNLRMMNN